MYSAKTKKYAGGALGLAGMGAMLGTTRGRMALVTGAMKGHRAVRTVRVGFKRSLRRRFKMR